MFLCGLMVDPFPSIFSNLKREHQFLGFWYDHSNQHRVFFDWSRDRNNWKFTGYSYSFIFWFKTHLGLFGTSIQLFGITADIEVVDEVTLVVVGVPCVDTTGEPTQISADPVNDWTLVALFPLKVKLNSSLLSSSSWAFYVEYEIILSQEMIHTVWFIPKNFDICSWIAWKIK